MSYSAGYGPVGSGFSPLDDNTMYRTSVNYSQNAWPSADEGHADLGISGYEMEEQRPNLRHEQSGETMASSLFTTPTTGVEGRPFLQDPINHIDTFYTANTFTPYKDHSRRQLTHILIGSSSRWVITFALCVGYVLATIIWQKKNAISEGQKKMYNTITTGISIALGLNIASAFKDMALNMRWPILASRKRSLVELDLILNADSLTKLAKLAFVTRRPMVIFGCAFWLFVNITAQAGIAMISLTYGFDVDYTAVQMSYGNVSIPNMNHFFPNNRMLPDSKISIADEEYTAHMYGEFAYIYGLANKTMLPKPGQVYQPKDAMLYHDDTENEIEFIFSDSPKNAILGQFSVYTERKINITYTCESYRVTAGGNGTTDSITVDTIGSVVLPETVPNSTTYITRPDHICPDNTRCSIVEAFEASDTQPWYYYCNITLGATYNDQHNLSFVSDYMAQIATASIAQIGHTNFQRIASQIYPIDSPWGGAQDGNGDKVGFNMAMYALASIAGATQFNPYTGYMGNVPAQGVYLHVGHPYFFYIILGLICGFHLIFVIVVAIWSNNVMVGPDGHLSMSLLLRPIADALEGVSNGIENKVFRDAKRNTNVIYEKDLKRKRWILNMVDR